MNLGILALGLGCLGVSLGEGFLVGSLMKAASRQPEIIDQLRAIMLMGVAFIEGTFFVTLAMAFVLR